MIHAGLQSYAGSARAQLATALAGALLVTAFAPFGFYWLAPLLLAVFVLAIEYLSPRQAVRSGFLFGAGLFAAGTWWLYISLNILGGLWPPLAVLLMLLLVCAMAAYSALAAWLITRFSQPGSASRWLLMFPAVWTLTEWLRGWFLTGFPWMSMGYSQAQSPLGSLAPLAGLPGVSLLVALLAGALVTALLGNKLQRVYAGIAGLALLAMAVSLDGREWTTSVDRDFRVRLVQGAVPQELKWELEQRQPTLDTYRRLSQSSEPLDLIVWPEAAVPALPFEVKDFLEEIRAEMLARDTQIFLGMLTYDIENNIFLNTLWALGDEQAQYHKRHLVPFGEYFPVPDFVRDMMRLMNLPSENITAGQPQQNPLYAKGVAVAPTICYEIAYGAEQLSFFPEAELLVNVSNDAWFGDTIAPQQHLQINQFRARETGRFMLRATNTGITAVIDPLGRVVERIPQFEPGAVDATVTPQRGLTPYLRWGNWPVVGFLLLVAVAVPAVVRRS